MANYLVSYNRSGNTWLRFLIEFASQRPTTGHSDISIAQRLRNVGGSSLDDVDVDLPPIAIKRHEFEECELTADDRFVLILRDPVDCIWTSMGKQYEEFTSEFLKYRELIRLYDEHAGEKIIVYYENLLKYPLEYGIHVTNFFGKIATCDFNADIGTLKDDSYRMYNNPIHTRNGQSELLSQHAIKYIREVYSQYETNYIDKYS